MEKKEFSCIQLDFSFIQNGTLESNVYNFKLIIFNCSFYTIILQEKILELSELKTFKIKKRQYLPQYHWYRCESGIAIFNWNVTLKNPL